METMTTLTVTKRGQVTFRKDVLRHLGIQPGGKIRLDLLPDGGAELPQSSFRELHGFLSGQGNGKRLRRSMTRSLRAARQPAWAENENYSRYKRASASDRGRR
jgi:bifunctional DNA-binding transcriptional regulator/antitoxin component of YhaV-PrlF toxin-antitoxin module